jgi:hypothetical protein
MAFPPSMETSGRLLDGRVESPRSFIGSKPMRPDGLWPCRSQMAVT